MKKIGGKERNSEIKILFCPNLNFVFLNTREERKRVLKNERDTRENL